ncbi:MAG: DUF4340 domain-containing protein [Dehalococcoidia bacterium]
MNLRLTGVLLVVLAVLGAYVFLVEVNKPEPAPPGVTPVPTPVAIVDGTPDQLSGIEIRTAEGRAVLSLPAGGSWQLTEPAAGEADQVRLLSLVGRLLPLTANRVIADTSQLGQYGLQNPNSTLVLNKYDGSRTELRIGDQTALADGYYVRVGNDGPVYIVSRAVIDEARRLVSEPPRPRPTVAPSAAPAPSATPGG